MGYDIKSDDLVLEVGSGDFPSHFSDVLVDKYPDNNFKRNRDIWLDGRLFIVADAEKLPFRDKAFDYCIAANILPYMDDPEVFFNELMRVAPRGMISAISELYERLRDIEFHKWYVNLIGGKLTLKKKERPNKQFGKLFDILYKQDKYFFKFFNKHWPLFNLAYHWQGSIDYKIVPPSAKLVDFDDIDIVENLICDRRPGLLRFLNALISPRIKNLIMGNYFKSKKKRKKVALSDILACPVCRNSVVITEESIKCKGCNKVYPVKNGIPYMLA